MEPSLSLLWEELKSLANKWDVLATRANLPPETVQALKSGGVAVEDCLREVLRHWIEIVQEEGGAITWPVVLDAVRYIDMELADSLKGRFVSSSGDVEMEVASGGQAEEDEEVKSKLDDAGEERMEDDTSKEEPEKEEPAAVASGDGTHVYSPTWSKLSREDIVDCIRGLVYGQAIGDALGMKLFSEY